MQFIRDAVLPDYLRQQPCWFFPRILVGAGAMLTPAFVSKHNITHVINCAYPEDSPGWFQSSFPDKYVCINADDTFTSNILDWFANFETSMRSFLREGNGTVFVHCRCGINRSAFLALTYVAKNFHMGIQDVITTTTKQRPCMYSNRVYRTQVLEFINGCVSSEKNP
jgi:hypothetical protein